MIPDHRGDGFMTHSPHRRRVLAWIGAAAAMPLQWTPAFAEEHAPTPRMTEGPFYPRRFPADSDADLTRVAGERSAAEGRVLDLTGRVLDRNGRPRAGARVEIWQCDAYGQYHHIGEPEGSVDPGFQGFGAVVTDAEGRYAFRTIKPVPYPGRTPHIHFTVAEGGKRRLTSQMFVEGEPGNERDGLYRYLGRDAKLVTLKLADSGAGLRSTLDIVIAA
jgi:protocatechuate 3,4-dioxygenase beta subunit